MLMKDKIADPLRPDAIGCFRVLGKDTPFNVSYCDAGGAAQLIASFEVLEAAVAYCHWQNDKLQSSTHKVEVEDMRLAVAHKQEVLAARRAGIRHAVRVLSELLELAD